MMSFTVIYNIYLSIYYIKTKFFCHCTQNNQSQLRQCMVQQIHEFDFLFGLPFARENRQHLVQFGMRILWAALPKEPSTLSMATNTARWPKKLMINFTTNTQSGTNY